MMWLCASPEVLAVHYGYLYRILAGEDTLIEISSESYLFYSPAGALLLPLHIYTHFRVTREKA